MSFKIPYEARCNLLSLNYVHCFSRPLGDYFRNRNWGRIAVLGSDIAVETLRRQVPGFDYVMVSEDDAWSGFVDYDVVLDFLMDSYLRSLLQGGGRCVSLRDLLVRVALDELRRCTVGMCVGLVLVNGPHSGRIDGLEVSEWKYIESHASFEEMAADTAFLKRFCATEKDYRYATDIRYGIFGGWTREFNGKVECLSDVVCEYVNVDDGIRRTTDQPESPDVKVHVYGSCIAQGVCVTDENTIESCLQRHFNRSGRNCAVVNHGVGDGRSLLNAIMGALITPVCAGDTIVVIDDIPDELGTDVVDASDWFRGKRPDEVMFFNSAFHLNATANELMARRLYELIGESPATTGRIRRTCLEWSGTVFDPQVGDSVYTGQIVPYMRYLSRLKKDDASKCAAVLINADPFTLGHRHLIEKALEDFDHVYVFLVDQMARFSFEDRFEMVRVGTMGLSVTVLRAEEFFASSRNFPEYFNRSSYVPGAALSVSVEKDLRMMVEKVFPFLRVRTRFMGEEVPMSVTWKYNELVAKIGSEYGLETRVVSRLKVGGSPVSSSKVRRLYDEGRFIELRSLVPEVVADCLELISRRCSV